jgi:hypothetical protein
MHSPFTVTRSRAQVVWSLHRGRSRKPLVCVVPEHDSPLWRVIWPDIVSSPAANLSRCKDAARAWVERNAITKDRKTNAARRLKLQGNFWWFGLAHLSKRSGRYPDNQKTNAHQRPFKSVAPQWRRPMNPRRNPNSLPRARLSRAELTTIKVNAVVGAMRAGAVLHLHYERGRAHWHLSNGAAVKPEIALAAIDCPEIERLDVLPIGGGALPQTYIIRKEKFDDKRSDQ